MNTRNSHCSYCGHGFSADQPWPRRCAACNQTSYLNPLPVAVIIVPVGVPTGGGVVAVRRSIEPHNGMLALPGGYINLGETWQEAGAREVFEETGVKIDPALITDFKTRSAPDGTLLVFGVSEPVNPVVLDDFKPTNEASEIVVLLEGVELAFDLHTRALEDYFAERARTGHQ